jgi:hypothetical protein
MPRDNSEQKAQLSSAINGAALRIDDGLVVL